MDKKYQVAKTSLLFIYLLMIPFLFEAGYYVYMLATKPGYQVYWYKTAWVIAVLYVITSYMKMPYAVTVKDENTLLFKSLFSEREIPIKDMAAVKTNVTRLTILFKHKYGRISMINRIENRKELISAIRKKKKSLDIRDLK